MSILKTLEDHNLIYQIAEPSANMLSKHLEEKPCFYIGFDPTANSLHVGHLIQLLTMKKLSDLGCKAIALIGGATASIGDPSGRQTSRPVLSKQELIDNSNGIKKQIHNIVPNAQIMDNSTWSCFDFLTFVRETGSLFKVHEMIKATCFAERIDSLTFMELSYMLMQANDFAHLFEHHNCTIQIGGSDQWSNILAGQKIIKDRFDKSSFGLTLHLLTNSNGQKIGKTVNGATWLDENKTSVFDFFQFWRNIDDADVERFRLQLTNLPKENNINTQKAKIAFFLTSIVHGEEKAKLAKESIEGIFSGNFDSLPEIKLQKTDIVDILIKSDLAKSKREARTLLEQGSIRVNDQKIDINFDLSSLQGVVLCKGKKHFVKIMFVDENIV